MSWKRPPREDEGLMPQIMALLAPPTEFQEAKPAENSLPNPHQYFKVPGKGHNRDLCDACGEGGDIICCDRCPASFHLLCHEPPLDEDHLPQEWVCRACQSKAPKVETVVENNKKRGRPSIKSKEEAAPKAKQPKIINGKNQVFAKINGETQTDCEFKLSREFLCEKLEGIVSTSNAKSFSLSKQDVFLPNAAFPGESRRDPKKQFEVCDNGVVPKPFKVCFVCKKTCRRAALLSCDFCSLYYHLDCLDPPLAHIPSGMWMCPNHPHQFIEEKRLTTSRLSERLRYWDLLSKPVDHDEVQINFLRNGSRKFPPFRQKVRLPGKGRVKVPDAVKLHYEKKCSPFSKVLDESSLKAELARNSKEGNSEQVEIPTDDINGKEAFLPSYPSVFRTEIQPEPSVSRHGKALKDVWAFLVPVNSRMPSYPMEKSSIEVGINRSSDLYLPHYGSCKYVSEQHCVIFWDKLENMYELLNYSNFGTVVDGTNYVIGGDLKVDKNEVSEVQCKCSSPPSLKGWESSAILKHGSVLNFGCISFVFTLSSECTKLS